MISFFPLRARAEIVWSSKQKYKVFPASHLYSLRLGLACSILVYSTTHGFYQLLLFFCPFKLIIPSHGAADDWAFSGIGLFVNPPLFVGTTCHIFIVHICAKVVKSFHSLFARKLRAESNLWLQHIQNQKLFCGWESEKWHARTIH